MTNKPIGESIKFLIERCRIETQKYRSNSRNDMSPCFDLFRLAFEGKNNLALGAIFDLYNNLISHWVRSHPVLAKLNLPTEYFIADSKSEFFFAMSRIPFNRFKTISSIMAYWKKCVHTVIMQAERKQNKQLLESNISIDETIVKHSGTNADSNLMLSEIWSRLNVILNEEEQLLARYIFVQDLKPRQICRISSDIWQNADQVRVAQQRIKRKLKTDAILKEIFLD